jgi:hypothetical protein
VGGMEEWGMPKICFIALCELEIQSEGQIETYDRDLDREEG